MGVDCGTVVWKEFSNAHKPLVSREHDFNTSLSDSNLDPVSYLQALQNPVELRVTHGLPAHSQFTYC